MNTLEKTVEHPSCGSEKELILEVLEVGAGKLTGSKLNQTIGKLTGARLDYCGDDCLSLEALEALGRVGYIKPTVKGRWVCMFDHEGGVAITESCKTGSHAAAVALFFVLSTNKSVMT